MKYMACCLGEGSHPINSPDISFTSQHSHVLGILPITELLMGYFCNWPTSTLIVIVIAKSKGSDYPYLFLSHCDEYPGTKEVIITRQQHYHHELLLFNAMSHGLWWWDKIEWVHECNHFMMIVYYQYDYLTKFQNFSWQRRYWSCVFIWIR